MSAAKGNENNIEDDIQKPKKAASAFWLFGNSVREGIVEKLKKDSGKAMLGDVAKAVKARWEEASEETKTEFEKKALLDRERHAKEMKAYLEASDPAGTLRKKYVDLIPRKPMTPYFMYLQDADARSKAVQVLQEAGESTEYRSVNSKLSNMWKDVAPEVKSVFEEKFKAAQAEFLQKQKEWQTTPEFKEIEAAERLQENKRKEKERLALGGEVIETKTPVKKPRKSTVAEKAKDVTTPHAKSDKSEQAPQPAAKRSRKSMEPPPGVDIDVKIVEEATGLGYAGLLKNLANRPEVIDSGKTFREILDALKTTKGLVNPAKRILLDN